MKKKKLNLNELAVKSFVTSFDNDGESHTIKGGAIRTASGVCVCRTEDCETQVACDLTETCAPIKTMP